MKLFDNPGIHVKIFTVLFIPLNQLAELFYVQRQIVLRGIAFGIRGLEFFKGLTHAGRLQNCLFNLYPQGFGQLSLGFVSLHFFCPA